MSTRRHAVRRGHRAIWIVSISMVVLVAMAVTAAYAGYRYEQNRSALILPGVRISGIDVSGMTRSEAEAALKPTIAGTSTLRGPAGT